jgi:hypothetical protein
VPFGYILRQVIFIHLFIHVTNSYCTVAFFAKIALGTENELMSKDKSIP